MSGLPDAHSGPGFATLVGLAQVAATNPADLRPFAAEPQTVHRTQSAGLMARLMTALKSGY